MEPIKRRSLRKITLIDSNASKLSKVSTNAGSNKKVLWFFMNFEPVFSKFYFLKNTLYFWADKKL